MPKTIEQKIQDIDTKIIELQNKKKQLLIQKREQDKKEKQKLLNEMGALMESKGFKSVEAVKEFLNQNSKNK